MHERELELAALSWFQEAGYALAQRTRDSRTRDSRKNRSQERAGAQSAGGSGAKGGTAGGLNAGQPTQAHHGMS